MKTIRFGVRLLASLLLMSLYLPVGVAQATSGDTFVIGGLSPTETAGIADINLTLTAMLAGEGGVDTTYAGTAHFSSTDGSLSADIPGDIVFTGSENGTATFDVTFATAGPQTLTATDTVDGAITGSAGTTVNAGPAASVDLSATTTFGLTSGSPRSVIAHVTDTFGNDVPGASVLFARTGGGSGSVTGLGTHATDSSGVATDIVTGALAGALTISASTVGHGGITGFTVNPGPLDHVTLTPNTSTISPGGSQTYTTTSFDAAGNSLGDVSGSSTLAITPNGSCGATDCTASIAGAHIVTTTYLAKTDTATLTVGNNPPVAVADSITVNENAPSAEVDVLVNDGDPDSDPITVISASNPPHGSASVDGDGLGVHYNPDLSYSGPDSFTYTISDGIDTDTATVSVTVTHVNQQPTFAKGADQNILENASAQSITPWATAVSPGPGAGDAAQTVHFNVTGDTNSGLFSVLPAISSTGTLTYTPAANTAGSATISITLQDNGGTGNGGIDTSAVKTFAINVAGVNQAPTFTSGADDAILEDAGAQTRSAWATSIDEGAGDTGQILTFIVSTNNNPLFSVLPAINSTTGDLTYTTVANANGSATLTITLMDSGGTLNGGHNTSASATMHITVTAVNDPPTFVAGSDPTVLENSGAKSISGWATSVFDGPPNETGQTLNFIIAGNNNPGLFAVAPAVSPTGTLTFTPAANVNGSATISLQLHDNGGTANSGVDTSSIQTFVIHVTHVNEVPSFTKGGDQSVFENSGAQSVFPWATNPKPGADLSESGQALNYIVTNNTNALFSVQPAVASDGTLTFAPAANEFGTAIVSVQIHDDGGTANSGTDTSAIQTFTITINFVNQAPTFTAGANQAVLEDSAAASVPLFASAISSGPNDPTQALNFIVTNDNNPLFNVQPAISPTGTLSYTLTPNANGVATVSVSLHDNGGTANAGSDTSTIQTFTVTVAAVNDAPTFVKGANISLAAESSPVVHTVAGWATGFNPGPADESGQTVLGYHIVSNDRSLMFNQQPAIDASGNLTYQLGANRNGLATITVDVQDNGGVANGGFDTSAIQTFTINATGSENPPAAINDFPVTQISAKPNNDMPLIAQGSGPVTINPLVNDFDVDGDPLTIIGAWQGAHGVVHFSADHKFLTYDPIGSYIGPDSFLYEISDGRLDSGGHPGIGYATVTLSVVKDTFAPVATTPVAWLAPAYGITSWATIALTWSGSDQGFGVKYYQLEESRNSGAWVLLPVPVGARSTHRGVAINSHYQYRVRAIDLVGNIGPWAYLATFTPTEVPFTSSGGTLIGAWSSHPVPSMPGGRTVFSSTRYATASYTCTCSSVSWYGPEGPGQGSARVYVDGVLAPGFASEHATTAVTVRTIYARTWGTVGVHTVVVQIYSGRVDIGGYLILH